MTSLTLTTLDKIPMIEPGDDISGSIIASLIQQDLLLKDGDVLVIAQKIVSKAEGRFRNLRHVQPSTEAIALAEETEKDPRLVQAILDESSEVVRKRQGVLIVRHKRGWVMAQAGIDQSNVQGADEDQLLLLPEDPDRSAQLIRNDISQRTGVAPGIVIADSFGRPFRNGTTGIAIGAAGITSFQDIRGERDLFGRELKVSTVAHADELAAAASILMGQADAGKPVVLIQGLLPSSNLPASSLIRPLEDDLFR